jgi:hypothetical protein
MSERATCLDCEASRPMAGMEICIGCWSGSSPTEPKGETMDPKRMMDEDWNDLGADLVNNAGHHKPYDRLVANLFTEARRARAAESTQTLRAEAAEAKLNEYIDKTKAAEAKSARLERELLAIAEATGFVNRPEGQGGYERATGERIAQAFRERDDEVARLERENEALRAVLEQAQTLVADCEVDGDGQWAIPWSRFAVELFARIANVLRDNPRTAATEDGT